MLLSKISIINTTKQQNIYRIKDSSLTDRCIIVESPSAEDILTDHFLVGPSLVDKTRSAVKDCIQTFFSLQQPNLSLREMTDVVPLSGALTYDVTHAFYELYKLPLMRCFIGIRRLQKESGKWTTEVSYTNFEGISEDLKLVFIGDTIATGVTIERVIHMIQETVKKPLTFVIFSIAGSLEGVKRLVELEKTSQEKYPGTQIWCLFTDAFFGLETNGTDMPVLHEDTLATEKLQALALSRLGPFLGKRLCSVLDWGMRTNSPIRHYLELKEVLVTLIKESPNDTRTEEYLEKCNKLIEYFSNKRI